MARPDEVRALRRDDPEAWTYADLPLLDAARLRLGDPEASRRRRRTQAAEARERARMGEVIDDLRTTARETGADEFGDGLVSMLVHDDLQTALVDDAALPTSDVDLLAGPFAHVVVDEAQELSDAEWAMLLRRCPSRSLTVVGDRAQARHGFAESWTERLARVGLTDVTVAPLTVNYRTPAEVMAEAEPVIRAALPEANVPTSVRESGIPVLHAPVAERDAIIEDWLAEHAEGTAWSSDAAATGAETPPSGGAGGCGRSPPSWSRDSSSTSWCSSTPTASGTAWPARWTATSR